MPIKTFLKKNEIVLDALIVISTLIFVITLYLIMFETYPFLTYSGYSIYLIYLFVSIKISIR